MDSTCQVPLAMGFSRQEYWSGLPCPPSGDLPNPGIEPALAGLLHWQAGSLPLVPPEKPYIYIYISSFNLQYHLMSCVFITSTLLTVISRHRRLSNLTETTGLSSEENKTNYTTAGTIVEVNAETRTIAILCQDRKVLRMSHVSLYKKWDRFFTKYYLLREIKEGSIII